MLAIVIFSSASTSQKFPSITLRIRSIGVADLGGGCHEVDETTVADWRRPQKTDTLEHSERTHSTDRACAAEENGEETKKSLCYILTENFKCVHNNKA